MQVRFVCAFGTGTSVWFCGILGHAFETCFWWSEYVLSTTPRLLAIQSRWRRELFLINIYISIFNSIYFTKLGVDVLVQVVLRPPYSFVHVVLVGPPLLCFLLMLSYREYVRPTSLKSKLN